MTVGGVAGAVWRRRSGYSFCSTIFSYSAEPFSSYRNVCEMRGSGCARLASSSCASALAYAPVCFGCWPSGLQIAVPDMEGSAGVCTLDPCARRIGAGWGEKRGKLGIEASNSNDTSTTSYSPPARDFRLIAPGFSTDHCDLGKMLPRSPH